MAEYIGTILLIFGLAFLFEIIDSAFGQGYGTLGSPVFVLLGYDPKIVVPAILISQAAGGLSSAFFHHKFKNANFGSWKTDDLKKVYFIVCCGIVGVIAASYIGIKISKEILSLYIGILVFSIGILLLSGISFQFTWKKLLVIGAISAFNKGLSGGGYGPLVAGGQTLIGVESKASVAITDFAETPICLAGFVVWTIFGKPLDIHLILPMCAGALCAPIAGAWITARVPVQYFKYILGSILTLLGVLCLFKLINP